MNLRGKSYCFFNEQLTKEAYAKKVVEFNLGSAADRAKLYDQFLELLKTKAIHRPVMNENSVNVIGSAVSNSKNAYHCFDTEDGEDARYITSALHFKDCMDCYHFGYKS